MTRLLWGNDSPARKLVRWPLLGAIVAAALFATLGGGQAAQAQGVSCENYTYQEDAQAAFDADPVGMAALDDDADGIACETLPRLPAPPAAPTETPGDTTPEATPEAAVAGATYSGDVEAAGDCGGGTVAVEVSADGTSIVSASVTDISADGTTFSATSDFDEGTVPIGDDGSFATYFSHGGVHEVAIAGTIDGDTATGSITITPSSCGTLSFTAVAGAVAAPTALPGTGVGDESSDGSSMSWAVIAGVLAVLGLGAGAFYLRRRMA
jgi:LPXTG-motif cell wall-anchored protein